MKRARRWILRLAGATLMAAALTGPAPGNVGGCGSGPQVANPVQHCRDKSYWLCVRDRFAERTNDAQQATCLQAIEPMCLGTSWPPGCAPTPTQSAACINLLQRADLASLTNDQIQAMHPECNLCL